MTIQLEERLKDYMKQKQQKNIVLEPFACRT